MHADIKVQQNIEHEHGVCMNSCCRWHLAVLGRKDGKAYLYNGLALLVAFILSRVVIYGLGLLNLLKLRCVSSDCTAPLMNYTSCCAHAVTQLWLFACQLAVSVQPPLIELHVGNLP